MEEKQDKVDIILKAALDVFAENGFHASPTSQIAKQAGVGVGTLYRYFESKDALIEALHSCIDARIRPITNDSIDSSQPIRENVLRCLRMLAEFLIDNPAEFRFIQMYYNSPYGVAKKRSQENACDKPLYQLLQRGIEQQVIKDLPFEVIFALLFGPIMMLIRDHLTGYFELTEEMIEATLDACWDALKR